MRFTPAKFLTEMNKRNLPGCKGRTARKADNFTCDPIILKIWEPQRLTTIWTSTACYSDIFTLLFTLLFIIFVVLKYVLPLVGNETSGLEVR
jgi:hypothetical protein